MVAVKPLLCGFHRTPGQELVNQNLARGHAAGAGNNHVDVVGRGTHRVHTNNERWSEATLKKNRPLCFI